MEPVGAIWRVVGISSVAFNWHTAQGREQVGAAGTMAGLADVTNWRLKLQQQRSLSPRDQKESTSYVGWLVCFVTLETCVALGDGESDSSKMTALHLIYNLEAEFKH
ncbi:unnamed protein product [Sphagnum balticum]